MGAGLADVVCKALGLAGQTLLVGLMIFAIFERYSPSDELNNESWFPTAATGCSVGFGSILLYVNVIAGIAGNAAQGNRVAKFAKKYCDETGHLTPNARRLAGLGTRPRAIQRPRPLVSPCRSRF
jgi:hypothetical protein